MKERSSKKIPEFRNFYNNGFSYSQGVRLNIEEIRERIRKGLMVSRIFNHTRKLSFKIVL